MGRLKRIYNCKISGKTCPCITEIHIGNNGFLDLRWWDYVDCPLNSYENSDHEEVNEGKTVFVINGECKHAQWRE